MLNNKQDRFEMKALTNVEVSSSVNDLSCFFYFLNSFLREKVF